LSSRDRTLEAVGRRWVMPRQPEVLVRELDPDEAQRLVKITRTAKDRVRLRRAGIVLASVQGRSAAEAAAMFAAKPQYARGGDPRVQRPGVRGAGPGPGVDLGGGHARVPQDRLDIDQGESGVVQHPLRGGVPQVVQRQFVPSTVFARCIAARAAW
jgi:hypothetical protein